MAVYGKRKYYGINNTSQQSKSCVLFGPPRNINVTQNLIDNLTRMLIDLIVFKKVYEFRFTGIGRVDNLCYEIITKLKLTHPNIKRVLVVERESWNKASYNLPEEKDIIKTYDDYYFIFTDDLPDRPTNYHRNNYLTMDTDIIGFYIEYDRNEKIVFSNKQELYNAINRKKLIFFFKS